MAEAHERLIAKLGELSRQFDGLEEQLADPEVAVDHEQVRDISMKRSAMAEVVELYRQWREVRQEIAGHEELIAQTTHGNGREAGEHEKAEAEELVSLARAELPELRARARDLLEQASHELVTADDRAVGAVILEIRAGTGGDEAGLWAGDLLAMYEAYADRHRWKFETLDVVTGDQGGLRHAVASMRGPGVWQGMGYEGGVHCVKRVPATETQGRIHTSTATVAVLPEPRKLEVAMPDSDVTAHVTTAQGPGGQNVNKVATAVHLVHHPTGIEVRMQESKSQKMNREKAWQLLRARVHEYHQKRKDSERAEARSQMIGSGGRSERVRTYRWKETIVVDHRLEGRSFNLQTVMAGDLDELVGELVAEDRAQRLTAL